MADTKTIRVEILGSNGGGESAKGTGGSEEEKNPYADFQKDLSKLLHPVKTAESAIIGKSVIAQQLYNATKQTIKQSVGYYHQRYFSLKEDYLGENTYNQIKTNINKVVGLGESIAAGAYLGSSGGPIVAAVGAVIGGVSYVTSQVVSYNAKMSNFYQQLNATNYQTGFMAQKAGLVIGTQNTLG